MISLTKKELQITEQHDYLDNRSKINMLIGQQTPSTFENVDHGKYSSNTCKISAPILTDKPIEVEKGIESCLSNETDPECSLMRTATASTTFSMDESSYSSEDKSVDMQLSVKKLDTDTDDIDADSVSTVNFKEYGKYELRKPSVSELASERLYFKAIQRSKRLAILGESLSESIKSRNDSSSKVVDNLRVSCKIDSSTKKSIKSSSSSKSVRWSSVIKIKDINFNMGLHNDKVKRKKSISELAGCRLHSQAMERKERLNKLRKLHEHQPKLILETRSIPNGTHTKGIKIEDESDHTPNQGAQSPSEIAGCRLYLKAIERNKRLASRRQQVNRNIRSGSQVKSTEINEESPHGQRMLSASEIAGSRLYLKALERSKRLALRKQTLNKKVEPKLFLDTNYESRQASFDGVKNFQRLYALSKSKQEDGKKRRENIAQAIEKKKEVFIHPTDKISIADATRLYYLGMRQMVALERRRLEASEPGEYKPRFFPATKLLVGEI